MHVCYFGVDSSLDTHFLVVVNYCTQFSESWAADSVLLKMVISINVLAMPFKGGYEHVATFPLIKIIPPQAHPLFLLPKACSLCILHPK